jgi:thymidylate synthase
MGNRNTFDTTSQAYLAALKDVLYSPQYKCAPRGLPIHEITDYSFTVKYPDAWPIVTQDTERNKVIEKYTAQEMELYNSCSNRVEDFAKASKFWEKIANADGTINSAYGYLIWKNKSLGNADFETKEERHAAFDFGVVHQVPAFRTPWEWCLESLKADKDTRQAILRFSLPEHHWVGNKDFVCTLSGNFLIRNNKLNFSVVMRSQDLVLGAAYDWPWFVSVQQRMVNDLRSTYPGITIGSYTHYCHSAHIYERDFEKVRKMIGA